MAGEESDGEDEYNRREKPVKDKHTEVNYRRKREQEMGEEEVSDQEDIKGEEDAQLISSNVCLEEENSHDRDRIDPLISEEMEGFAHTFKGFEKRYHLVNKIGESRIQRLSYKKAATNFGHRYFQFGI